MAFQFILLLSFPTAFCKRRLVPWKLLCMYLVYMQPFICDSAGILADSTHTTESGDVRKLGFIRKTGRYLLGGQVSWLPENRAQAGQYFHYSLRFVMCCGITDIFGDIVYPVTSTVCTTTCLSIVGLVFCRVDPCRVHPRGHAGVWGQFPPQL